MRIPSRLAGSAFAVLTLIASVAVAGAEPSLPPCGSPDFEFTLENRIGSAATVGYEPGIEIDSKGNIWTTAHKLSPVREEGTRLSSFVHRSTDGGATFSDVADLIPGQHPLYALEGDLAVDANDRMYFVDTWAADNHFYRFAADGTLETARPLIPTAEVDDRPWLAAHGDGFVYYMSNTGYHPTGRLTIHRSTDRGENFDLGFTLPESGWGFLDADPNSSYVYAVVNDLFYGTGLLGRATGLFAWISPDRGETWEQVEIAPYRFGFNENNDHNDAYPVVAVSPLDGTVAALWTDNGRALMLAISKDHGATWNVNDITPFQGLYSYPWVTFGPKGEVGINFQGRTLDSSTQSIYAMQWIESPDCVDPETDAACVGPASVYARANVRTITNSAESQADFFQSEISPTTGAHHVVWRGSAFQLWHARSLTAPSMGAAFCGHHAAS